jgi:hypothetical protein
MELGSESWCSELSSGIYCRVKWLSTDSETSVEKNLTRQYIPEDNSELHTRRRENLKSSGWWRQYVPLKRRATIILQGSTSQKTILNIILAAVRTWNHQDDGGSTYLWNVGGQSFYKAVHPRRQFWTSYSSPWELEISHRFGMFSQRLPKCCSLRPPPPLKCLINEAAPYTRINSNKHTWRKVQPMNDIIF